MTTAQDQQSRAEFEALAESLGYDTTDLGHGFCHSDTRKALKVWRAARALPAGDDGTPSYLAQMFGPGPALRPPDAQSQNLSNSAELARKPLTYEQIDSIAAGPCWSEDGVDTNLFARAIEAAHGITHPTGD